jgi:hypothetical protein
MEYMSKRMQSAIFETQVFCPQCHVKHYVDSRTRGHAFWSDCPACLEKDHQRFVEEMKRRGIVMG